MSDKLNNNQINICEIHQWNNAHFNLQFYELFKIYIYPHSEGDLQAEKKKGEWESPHPSNSNRKKKEDWKTNNILTREGVTEMWAGLLIFALSLFISLLHILSSPSL